MGDVQGFLYQTFKRLKDTDESLQLYKQRALNMRDDRDRARKELKDQKESLETLAAENESLKQQKEKAASSSLYDSMPTGRTPNVSKQTVNPLPTFTTRRKFLSLENKNTSALRIVDRNSKVASTSTLRVSDGMGGSKKVFPSAATSSSKTRVPTQAGNPFAKKSKSTITSHFAKM